MASMIGRLFVLAADLAFLFALAGCSPDPSGMTLSFETGEKVCQLTGDTDWATGRATTARTESEYGFAGTDLGYPVEHHSAEHKNGLALFFGDSRFKRSRVDAEHPESGPPDDVIGWVSTHTRPTNERCLDLTIEYKVEATGKSPVSPVVGPMPIKQGLFNVPSGGVSSNGLLYGFFWTDHCLDENNIKTCPGSASLNKIGRGVLVRSEDDGRNFIDPIAMPRGFVYSTAVDSEAAADLPSEQRIGIYVFGVPHYRESVPYLAYAPPGAISDPAAWLFFAGRKPDGQPRWVTHAVWNGNTGGLPSLSPPGQPELFVADGKDRCVGEFSVTWNRALRAWLLLYNCDTADFGQVIVARVAPAPWGPWSRASIILDPNRDHSWCQVLWQVHDGKEKGCETHHKDDWSDDAEKAGKEDGRFYAPFVMERYTASEQTLRPFRKRATIYWLVSTWNPYQVVVMKTSLSIDESWSTIEAVLDRRTAQSSQ